MKYKKWSLEEKLEIVANKVSYKNFESRQSYLR